MIVSLWNLTVISAALLSRSLSYFRAIGKIYTRISWLREFTRSCSKTSLYLVNRGPVILTLCLTSPCFDSGDGVGVQATGIGLESSDHPGDLRKMKMDDWQSLHFAQTCIIGQIKIRSQEIKYTGNQFTTGFQWFGCVLIYSCRGFSNIEQDSVCPCDYHMASMNYAIFGSGNALTSAKCRPVHYVSLCLKYIHSYLNNPWNACLSISENNS